MSNNKQQTAVEFFYKEVWVSFHNKLSWSECERLNKIEEQAKAMHKEECITYAHEFARQMLQDRRFVTPEIIYNETFGGNNEQQ